MSRVLLFLIPALLLMSCNPREFLYDRIMEQQEKYFYKPGYEKPEFKKLTKHVYTFRWSWYRNIVVDTSAGLVVMDPFNPSAAKALREILDKKFPGKPVHALFYSHYHLDHASGGAVLKAKRIIAHAKCPEYWRDIDSQDVAKPTEFIKGDRIYKIGGVEIRLIHLGKSHTDTLYAFHLPGEKLLWTADFGLVKTILPTGHPDVYKPGVARGMRKLAKLDFEIFVPSHFEYGKKADFLEFMEYTATARALARSGLKKYGKGGGHSMPIKSDQAVKLFHHVYDPLKEKYGHWHGFNEQIMLGVVRELVGAMLGY